MAHFAHLDKTNTVTQVIVVNNAEASTEELGQMFIANTLKLDGTWKQTSYSGSFRSKYAAIGDIYNAELDAFVTPERETEDETE